MNTSTESVDITGIAVALGRIEEKVSHLGGIEDRLRAVESTVTEMKAQQKPRAPWWTVVGAVVGIVTGSGSVIALLAVLSRVGDVLGQLP